MRIDDIMQRLAQFGTAPISGCTLFGVGYEDAFDRLIETYVKGSFEHGASAEKFVVGPFGSGKTHFIRQLMEMARADDCVTSEVVLSKNVDFTMSLVVYKELCRGLKAPEQPDHEGMKPLLRAAAARVASGATDPANSSKLVLRWAETLADKDFDLPAFGRVLERAITADVEEDRQTFDAAVRWLSGEVTDSPLSKQLGEQRVSKAEENLHAQRASASLFQFIRWAGFRGTVACFDEAEQGLQGNRKKTQRILSMLQSGVNAIADLQHGSVLVVYALTPDLMTAMQDFPALQQRISDPGPDRGFFQGNTWAPRIDLTERDPDPDLPRIAARLVELYAGAHDELSPDAVEQLRIAALQTADEVAQENVGSSARRELVKRVASNLLYPSSGLAGQIADEGEV